MYFAGTYTMYSYDEEVLRSPAVSGAGNIRSYTLPSGNYSVIAINNRVEILEVILCLLVIILSLQ